MRNYLLLAIGLALASCASHKQFVQQPTPSVATPPPGVVVQPPQTFFGKLTGQKPAPQYYPPGTPVIAGRKSTVTVNINHVKGNQSNQTSTAAKKAAAGTGATAASKADGPVAGAGADLTNIEKPKAPVATNGATAKDQSQSGVSSDITGDNNAPKLTNTESGKKTIGQTIAEELASPLGMVIGACAVGIVAYGVYYFWWVIPRRKNPTQPTA